MAEWSRALLQKNITNKHRRFESPVGRLLTKLNVNHIIIKINKKATLTKVKLKNNTQTLNGMNKKIFIVKYLFFAFGRKCVTCINVNLR